jgi:hypothetical protein
VQGGLGGEPGNEAHGGYTYCGVASLALLGCVDVLDVPRLHAWLVQRQGAIEGGFNGRTNKLADGCYSFWQGAVFSILADAARVGAAGGGSNSAAEAAAHTLGPAQHMRPPRTEASDSALQVAARRGATGARGRPRHVHAAHACVHMLRHREHGAKPACGAERELAACMSMAAVPALPEELRVATGLCGVAGDTGTQPLVQEMSPHATHACGPACEDDRARAATLAMHAEHVRMHAQPALFCRSAARSPACAPCM